MLPSDQVVYQYDTVLIVKGVENTMLYLSRTDSVLIKSSTIPVVPLVCLSCHMKFNIFGCFPDFVEASPTDLFVCGFVDKISL